jgi:hypothetical protein
MIRITCINKDHGNHQDPHEAITRFGWISIDNKRGFSNLAEMVSFLENNGQAFVRDRFGRTAMLIVRSRLGRKYVKTIADGRETDNLLALSECSM